MTSFRPARKVMLLTSMMSPLGLKTFIVARRQPSGRASETSSRPKGVRRSVSSARSARLARDSRHCSIRVQTPIRKPAVPRAAPIATAFVVSQATTSFTALSVVRSRIRDGERAGAVPQGADPASSGHASSFQPVARPSRHPVISLMAGRRPRLQDHEGEGVGGSSTIPGEFDHGARIDPGGFRGGYRHAGSRPA